MFDLRCSCNTGNSFADNIEKKQTKQVEQS